jgi:AcrR family transcriptional regulator
MNANRSQVRLKIVKRSRRAAASDPTRDKLLDVAGRIFADRGYRAATIREICVAAGANVAAVNYHFGDKLGLYAEVVRQSARIAEFQAAQTVIDQDAPAEEVLRAIIRARLHSLFRGERPDWNFRILAHELAQPTPALRRLVNKAGHPLFHRLLELIGGMIGLPAEDESTRLCAISLLGQIMIYALAGPLVTAIWPEFELTPEQVDRIADHIADFSLSYIQNFRSKTPARSIKRTRPAVKPRASK